MDVCNTFAFLCRSFASLILQCQQKLFHKKVACFLFINIADSYYTYAGNRSCFTQFSVDGNPFTPSDEIEEEVEEIIDHGGVRL